MLLTDALVLHAFDYRETSRIVRLATREAGVVSAVARGARRPKNRFGSGLDLFTSGVAHLALHPTGDLHTLHAFDAGRPRPGLGDSLARFRAASALGELGLRVGPEDPGGAVFTALGAGLDAIAVAEDVDVAAATLAAAWRLVGAVGVAPTLLQCAACDRPFEADEAVRFAPRAGGALCRPCAALAPGARLLPAAARAALVAWAQGEGVALDEAPTRRAHLRLLREFVEEHLAERTPLRAWRAWETEVG